MANIRAGLEVHQYHGEFPLETFKKFKHICVKVYSKRINAVLLDAMEKHIEVYDKKMAKVVKKCQENQS